MKFSNIVKAVKGYGKIQIFSNTEKKNGEQWLSDGRAAYALENLPWFSSDTFPTAANLNWEPAQIDELPFPPKIHFTDDDKTEKAVEQSPITIDGYIPFFTQTGIVFIDSDYFRPFKGEIPQSLFFYERESESGEIYIAVKRGMILIAVIMPMAPDNIIESNQKHINRLLDAMRLHKLRDMADKFGVMLEGEDE